MKQEKYTKFYSLKMIFIRLLYIIIIPIIIYDVILIIQTSIKPSVTPSIFGIKTFNIISGSMSPQININDVIIVKKCEETELNINDIISYKKGSEVISHRIIEIENRNNKRIYTTKGDSNQVPDDEKIDFNQIEGKYIGKIPKIGNILNFLKNKVVFGIIFTILIIAYIHERKSISKRIERKEKREKFERKKLCKNKN